MKTAPDAIDMSEAGDRVPEAWLRSTGVECECPEFCLVDHNNSPKEHRCDGAGRPG
jgi:hypothetical protein